MSTIIPPLATALAAVTGVARVPEATNIAKACRRYTAQPAHALTTLGLSTENGEALMSDCAS